MQAVNLTPTNEKILNELKNLFVSGRDFRFVEVAKRLGVSDSQVRQVVHALNALPNAWSIEPIGPMPQIGDGTLKPRYWQVRHVGGMLPMSLKRTGRRTTLAKPKAATKAIVAKPRVTKNGLIRIYLDVTASQLREIAKVLS